MSGTTTATLTMPTLLASDNYGPVRISGTIASGADLDAGTILGRVTATGKFVAYDADGTDDGRRTAVAVLLEDAAAASADVAAVIGFAGHYVEDSMTGLDDAGKLALEARGLYFS